VAKIISQIKSQNIPAIFMENIIDPRLLQEIANETGAKIVGTLYSDALSDANGPAATYIDLMRNNIRQFAEALKS
jgi:zinc/manganese transport system substrate-binding protein